MSAQRHTARLVLKGHIIDSMMLPQVMDLVMDHGGNFTIEELKVGQHKTDTSLCRMEVIASSAEQLDRITRFVAELTDEQQESWVRLEALLADQLWQVAANLTLWRSCPVWLPGTLPKWVQDTQPDPVKAKIGLCDTIHLVADLSIGRTHYPAVPGIIQVMRLVLNLKLNLKPVLPLLQPGDPLLPRDGVPILVAHSDIDSAHRLQRADPYIAEIDAIQ